MMSQQVELDFGGGGDALAQPAGRADDMVDDIEGVPGSRYYPAFLAADGQARAMDRIDRAPWRHDLERRVQHYGWRYDYRAKMVAPDMRLGPLPPWLEEIARKLRDETRLFDRVPNQAIVNEYEPGQGIAMHVDRQCFGPAVATISLGDAWDMDLRPVGGGAGETTHVRLAPGSALILTGEARYRWLHGIARRRRERAANGWRERRRRVSLTFRTVEMDGPYA